MTAHLGRVLCGLVSALLVAASLKVGLFDIALANTAHDASAVAPIRNSFFFTFLYGLPLSMLAIAMTEIFRLRQLAVHLAIGAMVALVAAYFLVRTDSMASPAFAHGGLSAVCIIIIGLLSALTHWLFAGRRAGWRGEAAEQAALISAEAFRTASANAKPEYCLRCAIGWSALGLFLFSLVGWTLIDTTGLRADLIAQTEMRGRQVLQKGGYTWASFKVENDRGVIEGLAPDDSQKSAAYDTVREALDPVVGFPGVLVQIKNDTVARMPMSAVSQKLADAARRESEATAAVEAARLAAVTAQASEAEAKRKAEAQVQAVEAEAKRRADEQVQAAGAEAKRRAEEQAQQVAEETRRKLQEKTRDEAEAQSAAQAAEAAPAKPVEVAAADSTEEPSDSRPKVGDDTPATSPALDNDPVAVPEACTPQDLAMIESSRVFFDPQQFDISDDDNAELERVAASAQACASRPLLVSGVADTNGDNLFNPALGLQRAEAVRENLIARGLPPTRVVAKFAATSGGDTDSGLEDHAEVRRTEFRFLDASEITRDATQSPDERVASCEGDLTDIMSKSIIHFPTASAYVSPESLGLIRKLAGAIRTCGSVIVTIEGHTDKIGNDIKNQELSEARAKAVRESLVVAGADPTRVASRGFASSRPYDAADTPQAFALNRRIEFKVSGKFTSANTGGP